MLKLHILVGGPSGARTLDTLIDGLLFGTAKGGFTGSEDRPGYLEEASGGTIFLDELNSMSLMMQSKILRAALEQYGGNITRTASALEIRRQSLQYRIII